MKYGKNDPERLKAKIAGVLANMEEDYKFVGDQGATAIVQTTLAGIAEGDTQFAPYSIGYRAVIDSVGGKPRQNVDLRGLFYKKGQKKYRGRRDMGQGRRGLLNVLFSRRPRPGAMEADVVEFSGRTAETRPQRGITDKLSEMSLDLIQTEASDTGFKIVYTPREKDYMIHHNRGTGRLPKRTWFTANKKAVMAALTDALKTVVGARVQWFNDHNSATVPPDATSGK